MMKYMIFSATQHNIFCYPRDESAQKITDIFYNIHLSLDIWLYVCLCLALQLKIYYIFYIMAAESTQNLRAKFL